jgi:hypothetical protein
MPDFWTTADEIPALVVPEYHIRTRRRTRSRSAGSRYARRRSHANQEVMASQTGQDVKNKVLVAGASGLIGAAAIETFLAAGWDLIGISSRKPDLPVGAIFSVFPGGFA